MTMEESKVSVIMSVYNEKPEWLRTAIESILNQTHKNIEFIIILDNPDNTTLRLIIEEYHLNDCRVKYYINEENKGLVTSLNRALAYCTGEYIARMDADDISEKNRIELQLKFMKDKQCDIVACRMQFIDENGKKLALSGQFGNEISTCIESLKIRNVVAHPTWLVKRSVFEAVGEYQEIPTIEDYEWLCRAVCMGYKPCNMKVVLFNYRIRNGISVGKAYQQYKMGNYLRKEFHKALYRRKLDTSKIINYAQYMDFNKNHKWYCKFSMMYKTGCNEIKNREYVVGGIKVVASCVCLPSLLVKNYKSIKLKRINRGMKDD